MARNSKLLVTAVVGVCIAASNVAAEIISMPVPVRTISPKEELRKEDFVWKDYEVNDIVKRNYLISFEQMDSMSVARMLAVGRPVAMRLLSRKVDVRKGELLPATFALDGIEIHGVLSCEADGLIGDVIKVRNPDTGSRFTATITSDKTLQVGAQ